MTQPKNRRFVMEPAMDAEIARVNAALDTKITNPAGEANIADGAVTSAKIANGTIVDADINASAGIAKTKISGTALTAADTGTVTNTILADNAVTSGKIADGTIVNADINSAAAIDKTKISGTAITAGDTGTVTSTIIADNTIVNGDISPTAAIAPSKISGTAVTQGDTGTVTSTMILNGTIVDADINAGAAIAATKISGTAVTQADTGTVTSTMILDGTIIAGDIADGAITSAKILDGTIVNADVSASAAIAYSKLALPTADVDINTHKVINVVDPTSAQDAATKAYVDSAVSTGTTSGARTVYVKAGMALTKGQPVYISSADGTNVIVSAAGNGSEATSSKTIGLVNSALANNGFGYVTTNGLLSGLDTSAATAAGDPVWLGPSGTLLYGLSAKPVAPAHLVYIGIVTKKNVSTGEILINPQNGFELDELHNVSINSGTLATGQALTYDASTSLWKNSTPVNSLSGLSDVALSGPTTGQVLKYNGTAWANATGGSGGVTAQATAPSLSTASNGDAWFNTTDGTMYVCFVDADATKQWVQVQANSALDASIQGRVGALESQAIAFGALSPNYIINGAMDIWQRGTSSTASGYGSADRWSHQSTNTTWSQDSSLVAPGTQYSLKATMSGAGQPLAVQAIETLNAIQLAGKTITLSAYMASNVSVAGYLRIDYSTVIDNGVAAGNWTPMTPSTPTLTSSMTRYSLTVTIPSTAKSIRIYTGTNVNLASGNTFNVSGVQLEIGSTATSFRRNGENIAAELAACQRYFESIGTAGGSSKIGWGNAFSATAGTVFVKSSQTMRAAPSFSYVGGISGFRIHTPGIAISSFTGLSMDNSSVNGATLAISGASGLSAQACFLQSDSTGTGVWLSAEL